jgi:hypothetical protein
VLLGALLAGLAAASCSGGTYVSHASLAARVAQQQRIRTPDLTVGNVTCSDLRARPGATATCTVRVDAVDVTVRATYTGPDAVTLTPTRAAIDLVRAVEDVKARLPASAADSTVTCGPPGAKILLTDPGRTFTCSVQLDGTRRTSTFRVLDVDGHVQEVT